MSNTLTVKEHPILFRPEMVRAILDGRKTQTRRIIKPQPPTWTKRIDKRSSDKWVAYQDNCGKSIGFCPYGQPGDRLWVRENWNFLGTDMNKWGRTHSLQTGIVRYADGIERRIETHWENVEKWMKRKHQIRPSIHMPRWASRLTLEITDVRVERIQDISDRDARAEGFPLQEHADDLTEFLARRGGLLKKSRAQISFGCTWDTIHSRDGFSWEVNPWVWVIGFKKI